MVEELAKPRPRAESAGDAPVRGAGDGRARARRHAASDVGWRGRAVHARRGRRRCRGRGRRFGRGADEAGAEDEAAAGADVDTNIVAVVLSADGATAVTAHNSKTLSVAVADGVRRGRMPKKPSPLYPRGSRPRRPRSSRSRSPRSCSSATRRATCTRCRCRSRRGRRARAARAHGVCHHRARALDRRHASRERRSRRKSARLAVPVRALRHRVLPRPHELREQPRHGARGRRRGAGGGGDALFALTGTPRSARGLRTGRCSSSLTWGRPTLQTTARPTRRRMTRRPRRAPRSRSQRARVVGSSRSLAKALRPCSYTAGATTTRSARRPSRAAPAPPRARRSCATAGARAAAGPAPAARLAPADDAPTSFACEDDDASPLSRACASAREGGRRRLRTCRRCSSSTLSATRPRRRAGQRAAQAPRRQPRDPLDRRGAPANAPKGQQGRDTRPMSCAYD